MTQSWPTSSFSWVPRADVARREAEALHQAAGCGPRGDLDMWRASRAAMASIRRKELRAPAGGVRSRLGPLPQGGAWLLVDPRPAPGEEARPSLGRDGFTRFERLRIAHELAHLLFYRRTDAPWRRLRVADVAEEEFCDLFAGLLVGPDAASDHTIAAATLAHA